MNVYELTDRIIKSVRQGGILPEENERLIQLAKMEAETVQIELAQRILQEEGNNIRMNIWLYSFSIAVHPDARVLKALIMMVQTSSGFTYGEKYFLFQQINSIMFKNPVCNTEDIVRLAWGLLEQISRECKQALKLSLNRIPTEELNKGISVVLVEQYLTKEHGPTKTALDRCYVLKKQFGQDVILINTAELLSVANPVYFENADIGNYMDSMSGVEAVSWQDETIRFFQCKQTMPCDTGVLELVSFIQAIKPSSVVLVGGTSLVAGLINDLVPVVTVGTIQSGLAITLADYQIIDRNMLEKGYTLLERMGKDRNHIIPGRFTFSLKPQTKHVTRAALGMDDDAFALAVVGGRLTDEVTDDFLFMLERVVDALPSDKRIVCGLIGGHKDFEGLLSRHEKLGDVLINVGFVTDILATVEVFDLYVNPIRRGGGTSVVEAMSKGLPAISVNYGDVAGIVGPDFCCESYDDMVEVILNYITKPLFYQSKSHVADVLACEYLDSNREFARIMREYYRMQQLFVEREPLLSVIVPCYNVEQYVGRCLDSIISQTIGIGNLDIVLVNDASTDGTSSILQRYVEQYPEHMRVINLEQNSGLSHARNLGIREAKAEYIAFVDSDDWIAPRMYEDLLKNGIAKGCDLAICEYDRPNRYVNGEIGVGNSIVLEQIDFPMRIQLLQEYRTNVYAWNKIYKRPFFTERDIWFPEGLCYEDNYVGFLALMLSEKIYITDAPYYHWYVNTQSITGTNKRIMDRLAVQNQLFDRLRQLNLYDTFRDEIDFNYYEKGFMECIITRLKMRDITIEEISSLRSEILKKLPQIIHNPYYLGEREISRMLITDDMKGLLVEDDLSMYLKAWM